MSGAWFAERNAELIKAIRSQGRPTFGTGRLRTRYKRCHEIAYKALEAAPVGTVTVQGIESDRERTPGWNCPTDGRGTP